MRKRNNVIQKEDLTILCMHVQSKSVLSGHSQTGKMKAPKTGGSQTQAKSTA